MSVQELSLSTDILDIVRRYSGGSRVLAVRIRVRAMRGVTAETLAFYFDLVARGTECADAELEQELVPARILCAGCGIEAEVEEVPEYCSICGRDIAVSEGNELEVQCILVEEDAPCMS
jgi:hydrogenase nickel incorporation protein HypA/HybF